MEIGVNVLGLEALFDGKVRPVLDFAARADSAGIDLICTGDHLGFNADAHAQRVVEHNFLFPLDHPWYEPISFLSSIAAVTERARLGVSVLIATVRPAALLAKQVATLDSLSEGRAVMGFGVGWQEAEYTATNMPFDARFGRMEETVAACRELWTNAPATFKGRDFAFEKYLPPSLPAADPKSRTGALRFRTKPAELRPHSTRRRRLDREPDRPGNVHRQCHIAAQHVRSPRPRAGYRTCASVCGAGSARQSVRRPLGNR